MKVQRPSIIIIAFHSGIEEWKAIIIMVNLGWQRAFIVV